MRQFSAIILLSLLLGLSGCTGAKLVKEGPEHVVVKAPKGSPELAIEIAEDSCGKYGKSAALVGATEAWVGNYGKVGPWKYVFKCQ
tara:strand:+ start:101 stop:358 length:258 start_codon:yes stop_codon:yes gene_type:complete